MGTQAVVIRFTSECAPCTREREGMATGHEFTATEMNHVLDVIDGPEFNEYSTCLRDQMDEMGVSER